MRLFRSIKWQLLICQTLLLAGVLGTLLTFQYQLHKRDLIADVDDDLQDALLVVLPVVAPPKQTTTPQNQYLPPPRRADAELMNPGRPRPAPRPRLESNSDVRQRGQNFLATLDQQNIYVAVQRNGELVTYGKVSASLAQQLPPRVREPQRITRDGNRELIQPHQDLQFIIGQPLDEVELQMRLFLKKLILIGSVVLLAGTGIGWLIITRALRPVRVISDTAEIIATGRHDQRIKLADAPEELESLATTLNNSFDHMAEAIEIQKRFTADASHELRTPVAIIIAQAEAALKCDRSSDEYKAVLQACLRAGKRMKNMANSLLELTRLNGGEISVDTAVCDLNAIASDAVDSASLLSEKHPVSFYGFTNPLEVRVDRDRIFQVLLNLLSNAVQHNPQGCALRVVLEKAESSAVIKISDEGVGIPPDQLPYIFERFYRVDKSRSRESGGAGLGLSIVQSLIQAHGGTISADSTPGCGATFTITLPLA